MLTAASLVPRPSRVFQCLHAEKSGRPGYEAKRQLQRRKEGVRERVWIGFCSMYCVLGHAQAHYQQHIVYIEVPGWQTNSLISWGVVTTGIHIG